MTFGRINSWTKISKSYALHTYKCSINRRNYYQRDPADRHSLAMTVLCLWSPSRDYSSSRDTKIPNNDIVHRLGFSMAVQPANTELKFMARDRSSVIRTSVTNNEVDLERTTNKTCNFATSTCPCARGGSACRRLVLGSKSTNLALIIQNLLNLLLTHDLQNVTVVAVSMCDGRRWSYLSVNWQLPVSWHCRRTDSLHIMCTRQYRLEAKNLYFYEYTAWYFSFSIACL